MAKKERMSRNEKEPVVVYEPANEGSFAIKETLKIDLGCGPAKTPGFIGVDRFPLPGVDVVCDLDKGIPFPDNSVDYVLASHSLEHISDLPRTIQEIFRICCDRAIVTIISPYHATGLNRANPYHKQVFNEHTARFFTAHPSTPCISAPDYDFPHAQVWGLGSSDHSDWQADLRPLRTEYFYFSPYRALDEESKRCLRSHFSDVCDQMVTHLLVVKTPITDVELKNIAQVTAFEETEALGYRRTLEEEHGNPDLIAELMMLVDRVSGLEVDNPRYFERLNLLLSRQDHFEKQLVAVEVARKDNDLAQSKTAAKLASLSQEHAELMQTVGMGDECLVRFTNNLADRLAYIEDAVKRSEALLLSIETQMNVRHLELEKIVMRSARLSSMQDQQLLERFAALEQKIKLTDAAFFNQDERFLIRLSALEEAVGKA